MGIEAPAATHFILPDFESHCASRGLYLRINKYCPEVSPAHTEWLLAGLGNIHEDKKKAYEGLQSGVLTSMCYPDAPIEKLRVCSDFVAISLILLTMTLLIRMSCR
jgi:hypothetical protein